MYPLNYFALFPVYPKNNSVFVAMSFDSRFDARWTKVIQPAINSVSINNDALTAHRVDARRVCDSVLTDILKGIGDCRLFLADVSTIGYLVQDGPRTRPIRNANVMYEVGIAHATRLPEEVILVRSDDDALDFDVTNIRVHRYDPDKNPAEARSALTQLVIGALRELDVQGHQAVQKAVASLDFHMWSALIDAQKGGGRLANRADLSLFGIVYTLAISRLLELGLLCTGYTNVAPALIAGTNMPTKDLLFYEMTPFGKTVFAAAMNKSNFFAPGVAEAAKARSNEATPPKKDASGDSQGHS